jgi:uncharacterized protein (DUF58 family)
MDQPELERAPPTDLRQLLVAAHRIITRRSLVFLISDFYSTEGWPTPLGHLAQRHEVLAVRIFDPLELNLPDLGLITMQDAETGEQLLVDTHDPGFRERFGRLAAQQQDELRRALQRAGVDALELSTDDDMVEAIIRFASLRTLTKPRRLR